MEPKDMHPNDLPEFLTKDGIPTRPTPREFDLIQEARQQMEPGAPETVRMDMHQAPDVVRIEFRDARNDTPRGEIAFRADGLPKWRALFHVKLQ